MALTYMEYATEVLILGPWRELGMPRRGKVLEIGSGGGWGITVLRSIGLDPLGLDVEPKALPLVRGTGTCLPFRTNAFDGVVCIRTLMHIREDDNVLRESARVVRQGGFVFLVVGNRWSYTLLALRLRIAAALPNPVDSFYRLYDRRELQAAVRKAGFDVVSIRTSHYLPRSLSERRHRGLAKLLVAGDMKLGSSRILGRYGPLLLVYGVKR
jgi:SAM-dependent methyltransferase